DQPRFVDQPEQPQHSRRGSFLTVRPASGAFAPRGDDRGGEIDALRFLPGGVFLRSFLPPIDKLFQGAHGGTGAGATEDLEMLLVGPEENGAVAIAAIECHARVAGVALELLLRFDTLDHLRVEDFSSLDSEVVNR